MVKQTKEFEEAQQDLDIIESKAAISFKNQGQEPDQKLTNAVNTDCDDNVEYEDAATTFGKVKSTYEQSKKLVKRPQRLAFNSTRDETRSTETTLISSQNKRISANQSSAVDKAGLSQSIG